MWTASRLHVIIRRMKSYMKAVCYDGEKAVYRSDVPLPERKEGESLIRIIYAAVCSTDREILKGYRPSFRGVMGHEFVGIVESTDNPSLLGKRVVGEINENCGECLYCRTGRPHHCSFRRTPGLSRDGCFAQYMVLRDDMLHIVPDSLSSERAVFTEPLAAAFEITEQVKIEKGMPVAVIGDGRLALCIANVMHLLAADLTVIGKHRDKLSFFSSLGRTAEEAEKEGYEVVIEAVGNPSGIECALNAVRKKGTVVLKSTYASKASIELGRVVVNELTLVGSRCGPFEPALDALTLSSVVLPPLEKYRLSDYEAAFASHAFKAGFEM